MFTGTDKRGIIVRYYGPVIFFAVLIFIVSSLPGPRIQSIDFNLNDKIAHCIEFGLFGILLYRMFKTAANVKHPFLATVVTGLAYAAFDEIHQAFVPGRYSDITDFAADAAGIFLFGIVFVLVVRHRGKSNN